MGKQAVVVHAGPLWEVQLLQGMLEEEGIRAFIPDESTKRVDPFITGANPLAANLVVAKDDAERASALIEKHKEVAEARDAQTPPHHAPTETERLARIGTRVRWASIMIVTAPFAIYWGMQYLLGLRGDVPRPRHHGLTIAAIFLALVFLVGFVLIVADPFEWRRDY